jgi:hypothetical protein
VSEPSQLFFEKSIPLLTKELDCLYCVARGVSFSWESCFHYGKGKSETEPLEDWKSELSSNVETFDALLANFLKDTFDAQIEKVQSINDESPHLLVSIARHAWPLDTRPINDKLNKIPGIQALPNWLSMGDYNSIYKHTIAFLNLLEVKLSHLKKLDLILYMGSGAMSQFAFNDALSAWICKKDLNWYIYNMYMDYDYEYMGIASPGFHMRPNASHYWMREKR